MRPFRTPLALLTAAVAVMSCVGGDTPTDEGRAAIAHLALQPALIPSPADGSALPVNRVRTVVARASDGAMLAEQRFDVSSTAATWALDIDVPAGRDPVSVVVFLYLLNVASDGTETVQFSGRTPPFAVTAGERITDVDADIVRGPLDNLAVTGVTLAAHPATLVVGSTMTLSASVTTDGSTVPSVFWTALDPQIASAADSVVTGVAPGAARVVASAGAFADTASITVVAVAVDSVRVLPDSADVAPGATRTYTAQLRDAAGNLLSGRVVTWTTGSSAVATVDANSGVVTGVAPGTTTVRATSEGQFDEAIVRVPAPTGVGALNAWLAGSGNWSDPAKWSLNRVPLPTDSVSITAGGGYTVAFDMNDSIAALELGGTSLITFASTTARALTVAGDVDIYPTGRVEMAGGLVRAGAIHSEGVVHSTGAVTIDADVDNSGQWLLTSGTQTFVPLGGGNFVNEGTIDLGGSSVLNLGPNAILDIDGGTIVGDGFLNVGAGSFVQIRQDLSVTGWNLILNDAELQQFGQRRVTVASNASVQLLSQIATARVQPKLDVSGDIVALGPNVVTLDSMIVRATGTLLVGGTTATSFETAAVDNFGDISLVGPGAVEFGPGAAPVSIRNRASGDIFVGAGAISLNGQLLNEGEMYVLGNLTIERTNSAGTAVDADHVNSGIIETVDGATVDIRLGGASPSITNSGVITVGASTTLVVTNLAAPQVGIINNTATGVLQGHGTVDVRPGIPGGGNNGTISPGTSPGRLTWLGSVPMGPTGRIQIELEGASPGTGYDQLAATADLILNGSGTLDVTAPGFTPTDGARYAVLVFGQRQGTFGDVNLPTIPGFTMDTVWTNNASAPDTLFVRATATGPAPGNLNRWTGAVNTDWGTAGNWSKNAVPVATDSVVIDGQGVPNVVLTTSTTVDDLIIGTTGSFPTLSLFGSDLTLAVTGRVVNSGIISFQDNSTNDASMILTAGSDITVMPIGIVVTQGSSGDAARLVGRVDNRGTIWTASQSLIVVTGSGAQLNSGLLMAAANHITVDLSGGGAFLNTGAIQVDVSRTISFEQGFLSNEDNGAITGSGTLRLVGTGFSNDALMFPGVGVTTSILTVDGTYGFGPNATLLVDIGGATPGAHDQLLNTANVTLAGSLLVTVTSFQPQDGDRFPIMTFYERTGTFANVQLPFVPGIVLDTVWVEAPGVPDTLYIEATASETIPLGSVIGVAGSDADLVDGAGNPVNLVGTAVNGGLTTLSVGANPVSVDFNDLLGNGVDRTNGFERSDLLAVRADRKWDNSPLLLDLDNDGSFVGETNQIGIGMHAARFVTFDLAEIRADASLPANQAFTLSGYAGPANFTPTDGMSLVVLVDGNPYVHDVAAGMHTSIPFVIPITGTDRYITFAALEGPGLNEYGDHGGFANVLLSY